MAESGLPPPLPPQMGVMALMMSPAFTPLATASLPQTARKVIFSPLTAGQHGRHSGVLVPEEVAHLPQPVGVRLGHRGGEHLQPAHVVGAEEEPLRLADGLPGLEPLHQLVELLDSSMTASALSRSSPGLAFRAAAAWKSSSWFRFITSREPWPVVASIRRTPEATENSLWMWNTPTLAVLSRWVPPQNSTE